MFSHTAIHLLFRVKLKGYILSPTNSHIVAIYKWQVMHGRLICITMLDFIY